MEIKIQALQSKVKINSQAVWDIVLSAILISYHLPFLNFSSSSVKQGNDFCLHNEVVIETEWDKGCEKHL